MTKVTIGKWGKTAALRLPAKIVRATDMKIGEQVEVEARDRKIVVSRSDDVVRAEAEAEAAVKRIIRRRRGHSLGGISIRELIGRDEH